MHGRFFFSRYDDSLVFCLVERARVSTLDLAERCVTRVVCSHVGEFEVSRDLDLYKIKDPCVP